MKGFKLQVSASCRIYWWILDQLHCLMSVLVALVMKCPLPRASGLKSKYRHRYELEVQSAEKFIDFIDQSRNGEKKRVIFHCSSEGEWEQIKGLADQLVEGKKVSVVVLYTSLSVHQKINQWQQLRAAEVITLLLPLLTRYHFNQYRRKVLVQHHCTLVMVRYDFIPLLMRIACREKSILLWFNPKKKIGYHQSFALSCFDSIVFSQAADRFQHLKNQQLWNQGADFRVLNIIRQLKQLKEQRHPLFWKHFPQTTTPEELDLWKDRGGLITLHANAYLEEVEHLCSSGAWMNLLNEEQFQWWIVPHQIESEKEIEQYLQQRLTAKQRSQVSLIKGRGFLLSAFSMANIAIVGGSFARQAHSVWEPLLCGSITLIGPQRRKSSEFSVAKDLLPGRVIAYERQQDFAPELINLIKQYPLLNSIELEKLMSQYVSHVLSLEQQILHQLQSPF